MCPEMHQRMNVHHRAQPQMEGDIEVGWRQVGVVIARLAVQMAAARRLDGQDNVSGHYVAQGETSTRERGVLLWRAPGGDHPVLCGLRQRRKQAVIAE